MHKTRNGIQPTEPIHGWTRWSREPFCSSLPSDRSSLTGQGFEEAKDSFIANKTITAWIELVKIKRCSDDGRDAKLIERTSLSSFFGDRYVCNTEWTIDFYFEKFCFRKTTYPCSDILLETEEKRVSWRDKWPRPRKVFEILFCYWWEYVEFWIKALKFESYKEWCQMLRASFLQREEGDNRFFAQSVSFRSCLFYFLTNAATQTQETMIELISSCSFLETSFLLSTQK